MKYNKKIIGSIGILAIFLLFLFVGHFISIDNNIKEKQSEDIFVEGDTTGSKESDNITVYVNGEVKKPGVYKLKNGSRIEDALKISGGFTEEADKYKLNLAKKLRDEDYVYVDKKVEVNGGSLKTSLGSSSSGKININSASKEELKSIPGVGDVTAEKIIDFREKNRGFNSIDELKKIDRIGDKTFEKMKDKVDIR